MALTKEFKEMLVERTLKLAEEDGILKWEQVDGEEQKVSPVGV